MDPEPGAPRPRAHSLPGARGLRLHAWMRGPAPVSVVFLHGLGHHSRIWDFVADALPASVGSIAIDLRGHGDSAWAADGDYSGTAFIDDLASALRSLGTTPVILIGHSLGGLLALDFASKQAPQVAGLAILDVGLGPERSALERLDRQMIGMGTRFASPAAYLDDLSRHYVTADLDALNLFARHGLVALPNGRFREKRDPSVRGVLAHADLADAWTKRARIHCPTLVLRGRRSAVLTRRAVQRLVGELPQAKVVEVARAGHALVLERPHDVAGELVAFLDPLLRRSRSLRAGEVRG